MHGVVVHNATRNLILGARVLRAVGFRRRLLGLMFRSGLGEGEGLWIGPCNAVHTHFMRFPIDVIFLDEADRVVAVIPAMKPWRQSRFIKGARSVLELAAGGARATVAGDQISIQEA